MSRIGRMPVAIPAGVTVTIAEGNKVTVKGPKGTLERELPVELTIEEKDGHVIVSRPNDLKRMKSLHGLTRTLINNMIHGVTEGYEKVLEGLQLTGASGQDISLKGTGGCRIQFMVELIDDLVNGSFRHACTGCLRYKPGLTD